VATDDLKTSLEKFVTFARALKGDEKSEAQIFLDHFFRALGHGGVQEAGATLEFRIAKKPGSAQLELLKGEAAKPKSGGKKFADLLWPERVLIEMKSRKENLEKHYDQAFEYWTHIVPHRPPYVILCNFDEFWIYDFNTQLFDPVDRILLRDLPQSSASFNFLLPHEQKPRFGNNRVEVTRKAADIFAEVFRKIVARGEDRTRAQRFILQLLVSVVSEDIGLLPDNFVTGLLEQCVEKPADSFDLLGGLFRQMATEEEARGGRYVGIKYFNGGLFKVVEPVELKLTEADMLFKAADRNDWSQVKPEIFGTLFQHSMEDGSDGKKRDERHAFGAHFTSEFDIQKVVGPTIVRPWRERIEAAGKDPARLAAALDGLRNFQVLDPACGSGNFLFVAYREMKRLERDLLVRLQRAKAKVELASAVSIQQFHGIDILPFAVELAKVTLMLAKELEIREAARLGESEGLFFQEKPLPLDNLDKNIVCADALFTGWPKADAIIGNPPYLDARKVTLEHGIDYVKKLRAAFPSVPGRADFCTHWFRLAHDALPHDGRAGLVGTNTIRQNESREASLDYIVENGGVITEAISTQVWSGDAAVHVSIVNWLKMTDFGVPGPVPGVPGSEPGRPGFNPGTPGSEPSSPGFKPGIPGFEPSSPGSESPSPGFDLPSPDFKPGLPGSEPGAPGSRPGVPETAPGSGKRPICRLTFQRGDSVDSPWETYELPVINPALSVGTDVTGALVLAANAKSTGCFEGQQPGHNGFRLNADEAARLVAKGCQPVIFPYLNGDELLGAEYLTAPRFIIDFGERDIFAARAFPDAFDVLRTRVLADWEANAAKEKAQTGKETGEHQNRLKTWWQLKRKRGALLAAIAPLPRYVACSRVTKRPIFEFLSSTIRPDSSLTVFPFADDYSYGILQSSLHFDWFKARCSSLKGDFRYTSDTVFDTFPWPQFDAAPVSAVRHDIVVETRGKKRGSSVGAKYSAPDGAKPNPTAAGYKDSAPHGAMLSEDALAKIRAVAAAAVALRALRREIMAKLDYSLRELYRTLDTPGANPLRDAHARLDTAVRAAYGMDVVGAAVSAARRNAPPQANPQAVDTTASTADPLAFLLDLNLKLAAKEKAGEPITPPGLPLPEPERAAFITDDCITIGNPP
jgi:SAM-dependent methyltransferase